MGTVFLSWVGRADLTAFSNGTADRCPLLCIARHLRPERLHLLWAEMTDGKAPVGHESADAFRGWLAENLGTRGGQPHIEATLFKGASTKVMDFSWVFAQARKALQSIPREDATHLNITSGTSVMTAVWIVLATAGDDPRAKLFMSSQEQGVQEFLAQGIRIDISELVEITGSALLRNRLLDGDVFSDYLGDSPAIVDLLDTAMKVAVWDLPLLITGPPGAGKSLLAKRIHDFSKRDGDFVQVDCAFLANDTEMHNLFGWAKGAFTGAVADNDGLVREAENGTLLLDEIGDLPRAQQTKLLRLVQEGVYRRLGGAHEERARVRVIAATNAPLGRLVAEGRFRQDLLDRLNTFRLRVPALRDRSEDIPEMARRLLDTFQDKHRETLMAENRDRKTLDDEALGILRRHDWPGNVRELNSFLARLVVLTPANRSVVSGRDVERLLEPTEGDTESTILGLRMGDGFALETVLNEVERHYLEQAVQQVGVSDTQLQRLLGYRSRSPIERLKKKHSYLFDQGGASVDHGSGVR